ncbi:MAG: SDR family NAD(P)-dependent oxidoreductase, partial [Chloroflexota bacterium]
MRLQDRVCLVTGGAAGIGRATAERFCEEGAAVVICDLNEEAGQALAQRLGGGAAFYKVNVADRQAVQVWIDDVAARFGRIDVLVNNAGVLSQGAFVSMAPTAQRDMIDLNVAGLSAMLWAFLPGMTARGSGRVLNVASIASFQPVPSLATYAATKAYVLSLTESLAEELQGKGVTATA